MASDSDSGEDQSRGFGGDEDDDQSRGSGRDEGDDQSDIGNNDGSPSKDRNEVQEKSAFEEDDMAPEEPCG